jgi:hypothetical protein
MIIFLRRSMLRYFLAAFSFLYITSSAFAQDDLSALLDSASVQRENVSATFKSTRIINIQSNETVHKRTLDFRVAHRFGSIGKASGGNRHNFFGIDESSDIRVAFEYGITEQLTVGGARYKFDENYEALAKYRIIEQTNDNHSPVAVTAFGNVAYSGEDNPLFDFDTVSTATQQLRRISYSLQVILARKFSSRFSFELVPTMIHRNFVEFQGDDNTTFALACGGRIKVTRSMAVIADYVFNLGEFREINNDNGFYNTLGAGLEFETGGHVFSVMFTNAEAILESEFVTNTTRSWADGGFRFSFNISRNFKL